MITSLNKIREFRPCIEGWEKLLKHLRKTLADDEPLPLLTVLDSNGLDDALWCLRAVDGYDKGQRLFAVWCVRQVEHLFSDARSVYALNVIERYAHGQASEDELLLARAAAEAAEAARASWAAEAAAGAAAVAAARAAAWAASRAAAEAAAAETAAGAAAGAAAETAWAASRAASRAAEAEQETKLRDLLASSG